jgi:hypothetical protein
MVRNPNPSKLEDGQEKILNACLNNEYNITQVEASLSLKYNFLNFEALFVSSAFILTFLPYVIYYKPPDACLALIGTFVLHYFTVCWLMMMEPKFRQYVKKLLRRA